MSEIGNCPLFPHGRIYRGLVEYQVNGESTLPECCDCWPRAPGTTGTEDTIPRPVKGFQKR